MTESLNIDSVLDCEDVNDLPNELQHLQNELKECLVMVVSLESQERTEKEHQLLESLRCLLIDALNSIYNHC